MKSVNGIVVNGVRVNIAHQMSGDTHDRVWISGVGQLYRSVSYELRRKIEQDTRGVQRLKSVRNRLDHQVWGQTDQRL